ncbi:hypothetical protein COO60DRAFT_703516 [Scenedesmus sp. NREL 46B-D3]|nr:hypothetical protein COO60DRAFT_703516 [Scenedesmus sp. NREL 46B-D3]
MLRWAKALLVWQQQHLQPACCAATAAAIFCASTCFAAVALQAYIDQKSASSGHTAARVDALLFAPPNVGNRQFVRAFNARVNARKVQFAYDLVPQVPCAPSMAACPDVPVPTHNPDGSGIWQYSSIGGDMLFSPASMPHQASSWGRFGQIHPCKLAHFIMATHTCSYACWLSSLSGMRVTAACCCGRQLQGARARIARVPLQASLMHRSLHTRTKRDDNKTTSSNLAGGVRRANWHCKRCRCVLCIVGSDLLLAGQRAAVSAAEGEGGGSAAAVAVAS